MASTAESATATRLISLDAYRGFVMLAMASGGLGLAAVASHTPTTIFLDRIAHQLDHVPWRGCVFWDLIQPSFMFIVGVAMPFSYMARRERGQSERSLFVHALWRSFVLVLLGIFLSSAWSSRTNFTFVNVLTQIGLGYWFVYLMLGRSMTTQFLVATAILMGYWALFAAYPTPTGRIDPMEIGMGVDWDRLSGFPAHWEKNTNIASDFDRWFLNLFPRPKPFEFNEGGYATLNFLPSISTMLFGVLAGRWLRSPRNDRSKVVGLVLAGAICLVVSSALDPVSSGVKSFQSDALVICPIVKRIWTPSWVLYSTVWTTWMLAAFYGVIDVAGYRRWAFPLVVVGMNSIAMYVMAQLMKGWVGEQLQVHLGTLFDWLHDQFGVPFEGTLFAGPYGPLLESVSVLFVLWLICYWLYRQRVFFRI